MTLVIFLNCLNYSKYENWVKKWEKYNFVRLEKSELNKEDYVLTAGQYITKSGRRSELPMYRHPEILDLGYTNCKSDYFVSVDDDFEILNPEFILKMLEQLDKNQNLAIISTDKTVSRKYFDSYSNGEIVIKERNDTWFCIYKMTEKVNFSHINSDHYIDINNKKIFFDFEHGIWDDYISYCNRFKTLRYVSDTSSDLQLKIREQNNAPITAITDFGKHYENMYIHYAAFAKNKSINTPLKVAFYRHLVLHRKIGIRFIPYRLNIILKKVYNRLLKIFFTKSIIERTKHNAVSSLD